MKVLILKENEIRDFNESYAARLIAQGQAVIPPKAEPKGKPGKNKPAEETPAKGERK